MSTVLFSLGQCVITPGAQEELASLHVEPAILLRRHQSGDWGNLSEHDQEANREAIIKGLRVFSSYELTPTVRVWVITEADRSATTILLPEDY